MIQDTDCAFSIICGSIEIARKLDNRKNYRIYGIIVIIFCDPPPLPFIAPSVHLHVVSWFNGNLKIFIWLWKLFVHDRILFINLNYYMHAFHLIIQITYLLYKNKANFLNHQKYFLNKQTFSEYINKKRKCSSIYQKVWLYSFFLLHTHQISFYTNTHNEH